MLLVGHGNYPESFPLPLGVWGKKDGEWIRGLPSSSWGLGWEGRWMNQRLTIILLVTVTLHSHSRSLTVRHYSMKVRLRMEITRSWDCTCVLCNLEIGCILSRLEHNLRILSIISKLRWTYTMYTSKRQTKQGTMLPQLRLHNFQLCLVGLLHVTFISCVCYLGCNLGHN